MGVAEGFVLCLCFHTHDELCSDAHAALLGNWDLSAGRVA